MKKNSNHLQVRPVTRTETIFRIFLTSQETSIETNLNYSHLKYSSCTFFRSQRQMEDFHKGRL